LKTISTGSWANEIVIKEYEKPDFVIDGIDDETVESLSKFLDFVPIGEGSYKIIAKSYVGLVKIRDDLVVNILPKIEMNNLLIMLNYAYDVPFIMEEEATLAKSKLLVKFLIRIFLEKTREVVYKNYRKSYLTTQENRRTLKGRVLVKDNLRDNRFHLDRIFCEFDDFTDDVPINRIIKYVLYLLFHIDDGEFSRELRHVFSLFKNVSLVRVTVEDIDLVRYTRLNEAYKPVHMLCRLFVQNIFVSHKIGEQRMFCFVIEMNRLFEEFVRSVFRRFSTYRVMGHPRRKYLDETRLVKIKPDIRFVKEREELLVVDCKYKRLKKLEDDIENAQIINSDVYQILAYMVGYNLKKGMLIYPKGEVEKETEANIGLNGISRKIFVKPIDLNEIQKTNLQDFTKEVESIIII
jgi:5-methylcytosine-specific restriction enzyme subunit McrC